MLPDISCREKDKNIPPIIHLFTGERIPFTYRKKCFEKGLQIYNYFQYSTTYSLEYVKLF
jgi:hypothetical protein